MALSKHASSLAANETFTVNGRFATSTFLLNWPRTVLRWALLAVVVLALGYWYLRNRRRLRGPSFPAVTSSDVSPKPPAKQFSQAESAVLSSRESLANVNIRAVPFYGTFSRAAASIRERRVRPAFIGWLCGVLCVLLTGAGIAVLAVTAAYIDPTNSIFEPAIMLALGVTGLGGFLLLAVGIPIWYAGSLRRALPIFVHLLLFFIAVCIVLVALAFFFDRNVPACDATVDSGNCVTPATSSSPLSR